MRTVDSIAFSLTTGSAPGRPRQTGQVWVFGSAPNAVAQPQNILLAVPSSTWVSRPMTGSNSARASSYGTWSSDGHCSTSLWMRSIVRFMLMRVSGASGATSRACCSWSVSQVSRTRVPPSTGSSS